MGKVNERGETIPQDGSIHLDMSVVEGSPFTVYQDGDIVLLNGVRDLSEIDNVSVKTDMYMMVACESGGFQVDIDATRYSVKVNDALLCLPNTLLSKCTFSEDFVGLILFLSSRSVLKYVSDNLLWKKTFHISKCLLLHLGEENLCLFSLYGRLINLRLGLKQRPYPKEVMSALVCAIIYEMAAEMEKYTNSIGSSLLTRGEILFRRFIDLLLTSEVKSRSVAWYAGKLCVTPKYLSAVCKQESGKTPSEWIHEYMVNDIRHLLKCSNMSTKEIAEYLQFPNISFFGKYVKAHLGMSPKEYRKQVRNESD